MELVVLEVLAFTGPIALIYCWFDYVSRMKGQRKEWRAKVSVAAMIVLSVVALLYVVFFVLVNLGDWIKHDEYEYVERWHRVIFKMTTGSFLLAFFGKRRLILPIVIAAVGITIFWYLGSAP